MNKNGMFSLIVTTRNSRQEEFKRFIDSLISQSYSNFELIVVNQGNDEDISNIIKPCRFVVKEIPSQLISLSKARNLGLKEAEGDFIAFPDDDCWYDSDLLKRVYTMFNKWQADCISCNVYDPISKRNLSAYKRRKKYVKINELNATRYTISVGIFCKNNIEQFDEELGVGAKWGAGEETDYIYRLLKKGFNMVYCRDVKVYHPYNLEINNSDIQKAYKYGVGYGALVKKTIKRKQILIIVEYLITIIRTIGGIVVYGIKNKRLVSQYYFYRLKGMIFGLKNA